MQFQIWIRKEITAGRQGGNREWGERDRERERETERGERTFLGTLVQLLKASLVHF